MLRRLFLVLMLLAGVAVAPLARASQPCCEQGCDQAMPACAAMCAALCASPAAAPATAPVLPAAPPTRVGPVMVAATFDDWIAGIWNPPG